MEEDPPVPKEGVSEDDLAKYNLDEYDDEDDEIGVDERTRLRDARHANGRGSHSGSNSPAPAPAPDDDCCWCCWCCRLGVPSNWKRERPLAAAAAAVALCLAACALMSSIRCWQWRIWWPRSRMRSCTVRVSCGVRSGNCSCCVQNSRSYL